MDDEDKSFFILVLGVLAAVLTIVAWWAIQDDDNTLIYGNRTEAVAVADTDDGHEDADDDAADDHDGQADSDPDDEPADPEPADDQAAEPADDAELPPAAPLTVGAVLGGDANLTSVSGLVEGAGLRDLLDGDDAVTVLAPSNAALDAVEGAVAARLLADGGENVMSYHILPGNYTSDDLDALLGDAESVEIETIQGDPVTLSRDGATLIVNGNAMISASDGGAANGVVHTIENILIPREAALNLIVGLEPIQFASGSSQITAESQATLDRVVEALQTSDVAVAVEGHTDSQGDPGANQALSLERARSVVNYLVANGVDGSRLSAEGFGQDDPVADNGTEEGRALNRRIEFRIDG